MATISHQLRRMLALTLGAIFPAAGATVLPPPDPPVSLSLTGPPVKVIRASAHGGFNWGDAGIGAAGGVGLLVLALGGGLVTAQHRGPRSRPTTCD